MEINIAEIVAAVAGMAVGALWFSPLLFVKPWSKETGVKESEMRTGAAKKYALTALGTLAMAHVLVYIASVTGSKTAIDGIKLGFILWLGFVLPVLGTITLFEGRSKNLFLINASHHLVVLMVMGAIVSIWG